MNRIQLLTPKEEENAQLYRSTFAFFKQLSHFQMKGNPVCQQELLKDIEKQSEVLNVLKKEKDFKVLSQFEPTRSLRINVLGESGSGKTSVVQAFSRKKYVITTTHQKHRHTVGIDHYYFSVRIKGKTVLLNIWDHAGDDEYAMMNDLFISNNSLIWLVVSLRDYCPDRFDEDEAIFQRYIGHWLLQVMSHNLAPVIWIVCTHQDLNNWNKVKTDHIQFWKDRLCEKVQESLKESKLCHQNVPLDLKECIRIIELSNTYSFDGLDRLCNAFEELPSKNFCDLTSSLPVEWKTAFENLETYAEKELLSHQCIPALITTSEDFKKILGPNLHKDAFLEYLHDTGEIYRLKLNDEEIVVLNVDWMINLLKQVYHLNFNDELKLAKKASVCDEMIDDCPSMRENCGLIAEPILKSLWKCSGQKELLTFQKITTLFEKFNLTYRVEREKYGALQTFYFFPYLTKSSFPSKFDWQKGHIALRFSFKFFLPKLFLQRLALHFWRDNDNTVIYKDDFEAVLEDGVHLNINCVRRDESDLKPFADEMIIFASFAETDALWLAILVVLEHIHSILSSWKFGKNADVFVICPECHVSKSCEPNFIRLMQLTECLFANIFHSRSALYCTKCRGQSFIRQLIPSPHLKFPDFVRILNITKEKDFTSNIISRWELRDLRFRSVSGSSGQRTHPPVQTYSEGCQLGESDSSSSRQSSYSAHPDFIDPVEEVEDNN